MKKRIRKREKQRNHRFSLTLMLSLVVFCVLLIASLFALLIVTILSKTGVINQLGDTFDIKDIVWLMVLISIVIGTGITLLAGKFPLIPINEMVNKLNALASGNFKTRLHFGKLLSKNPTFTELSESFNMLAEELENTEMLRSDFINNISHEFKTPIVSISGLAKLLKKGNLTEEQRLQSLAAIEEESIRLSRMATNVLNLTKVENQTILTDVKSYNLSEQIRSSVLLLENAWEKKNIDLQLDFDEFYIEANEELMKQVFINLIDNAIKFTDYGGTVAIRISDKDDRCIVYVSNTGNEIPPENQKRIFNKFYQADESHSTEGNGIGLAIVKRIVDLHRGEVSVESKNGMTTFGITLFKTVN